MHPPGSHGLWLTCGHMSPTPLHNDHEQQEACHINFTLMGEWPGTANCTHCPDIVAALLWSQCDGSFLLWDACCTAAGMCWYIPDQAGHSSGMCLHRVDGYCFYTFLIREHFGSYFEDKFCQGKWKGFFHIFLHLMVVVLLFGSAIYMYMKPNSFHFPQKGKIISTWYNILTPMLNPIIYNLRNKEVKKASVRLIRKETWF